MLITFSVSIFSVDAADNVPNLEFNTKILILVNMDTDEVYYSQNTDRSPMASTTKIMTYIVAAKATAFDILNKIYTKEIIGASDTQVTVLEPVGESSDESSESSEISESSSESSESSEISEGSVETSDTSENSQGVVPEQSNVENESDSITGSNDTVQTGVQFPVVTLVLLVVSSGIICLFISKKHSR